MRIWIIRTLLKLIGLWIICFAAVELYVTSSVKLRAIFKKETKPVSGAIAGRFPILRVSPYGPAGNVEQHQSLLEKGSFANESNLGRKERSIPIDSLNFGSKSRHSGVDGNTSPPLLARRTTELKDIFISVKTTSSNHKRLDLILDTWYIMARDQVYFFTDEVDNVYYHKTRGHLINTNCPASHDRYSLCCKLSVEFDTYMTSNKRWFCHIDDDVYLNVAALVTLLRQYNDTNDWYLGKASMNYPLKIMDVDAPGQQIAFWFATGGAGFCLSHSIALKMAPFTSGGRLVTACRKIRLPDDCTLGYIVYHSLQKRLTSVDKFHSHLEGLWKLTKADLANEVTFSYGSLGGRQNVLNIPGFNDSYDPSRFRSVHCHLYPYLKSCLQMKT